MVLKKGEIQRVGSAVTGTMLSVAVFLTAVLFPFRVAAQKTDELPYRICTVLEHAPPFDRVFASDNESEYVFPVSSASLRTFSLVPFGNLWATAPGGTVEGVSVSAASGIVYVLARTGADLAVTELSLETGLVRAVRRLPGPGITDAVLAGGLIITARPGSVAAFTPDLAREMWRVEGFPASSLSSVMAAHGETIFRVGDRLVSVDADGRKSEVVVDPATTLHAVTPDRNLLVGTDRGEAVLIDGRSGRKQWAFRTGGKVSSIVVYGGNALISSSDNFIYSVRIGGGGLNWKSRTTDRLLSKPVINGRIFVFFNELRSTVEIRSLSNGRLLSTVGIPGDRRLLNAAISRDGITVFSTSAVFLLGDRCVSTENEKGRPQTDNP